MIHKQEYCTKESISRKRKRFLPREFGSVTHSYARSINVNIYPHCRLKLNSLTILTLNLDIYCAVDDKHKKHTQKYKKY